MPTSVKGNILFPRIVTYFSYCKRDFFGRLGFFFYFAEGHNFALHRHGMSSGSVVNGCLLKLGSEHQLVRYPECLREKQLSVPLIVGDLMFLLLITAVL